MTAHTFRPGDKVLVGGASSLSEAMAQRVKDRLKEEFPGVDFVLMPYTVQAVFRPEPDDAVEPVTRREP